MDIQELNEFYNELVAEDDNSYYSDSLKVVYLMILTGTFQEPCNGGGPAGSPTRTPTPSARPGDVATRRASLAALVLLLAFGIIFELPLVMALLAVVGLVKSKFLFRYQRHALVVCLWASPEKIWENVHGQTHRHLNQG